MLTALPARGLGLFSRESAKPGEDVPDRGWAHGQVVVMDIAPLPVDVRSVAVARTVDRLLRSAEAGTLGVEHLVIMADELNELAPAQGGESQVLRRQLQRLATQGRYAGLSLFGLCQSASRVDGLVRDNCASRALGVTTDGELSSGAYGKLSGGLAERVATLPKGKMALTHYSFRAPLVVQFPRPAWRTGKASGTGAPRPTIASVLRQELSAKSVERLTEGLGEDLVASVVAGADDVPTAVRRLQRLRVPDLSRTRLHEPPVFDPDDPCGLGAI